MKITFDTHSNVGMETTVYRSPESTGKVQGGNYALDISGTVMDNSAYAGHGRTAEEVMQEADTQDITARRNYMAVMSNSMSDEDFAKLQEDGFQPGSTDIETVVTIVDEIKAALLKGGTQVVGYTDTISDEALQDITGSETFARQLQETFREKDIPLTEENAKAAAAAYETAKEVPELSEGSLKYMLENNMEPSADNLYLAKFAGADSTKQGQGYYLADARGYYAKKPENIDYEQLLPQMEQVITEAGYEAEEETLADAGWLIEMGIPLNADTFSRMQELKGIEFPVSEKEMAEAAAAAIADGISPSKADITRKESCLEQAVDIEEKVNELEDADVDYILAKELPFQLKNLFAAHEELKNKANKENNENENTGEQAQPDKKENLQGRRLLEEVRLSMTTEANLRLLRSGYQIETAPMEELITKLKQAEEESTGALVQEASPEAAAEKKNLFQQTVYTLESIKASPAAVIAQIENTDTLPEVERKGSALSEAYTKAGESYEALMTAPRKDLGDSIKKAFRNVDDILIGMDKEITDENRKTVRILGYNSMEMTEENFEKIRQSQNLLTQVTENMKPGKVLSMIRDDVNPLTMPLEKLNQYLINSESYEEEVDSYSRFLYKLERKQGIPEEERKEYIGLYKVLRQIEKGDDAAVGALEKMGAEQTLGNLMTAVRTGRKHMDYVISKDFGGVTAGEEGEETEQADREYSRQQCQEMRTAMETEDAVLRQLVDYDQPVTADYLLAAGQLLRNGREIFTRLDSRNRDFPEKLESRESTEEAYEEMAKELEESAGSAIEEAETYLDVKSMQAMYHQISLMQSMAREENYTMPVEIGGEMTCINLKMIHKKGEDSKVSITLETELLGKNAAEFTFTESGLSGYSISSKKQGSELLTAQSDSFREKLKEEGLEAGDIRFLTGENLNLEEYSLKISKDRINGNTSDSLYKAARAYIGYVQDLVQERK